MYSFKSCINNDTLRASQNGTKNVINETMSAKSYKLGHHDCFCFKNDAPHLIVLPRINSRKTMNLKISTGKCELIIFLFLNF